MWTALHQEQPGAVDAQPALLLDLSVVELWRPGRRH
jgi:hypothetical protein